jgi:hypothetical protein
MNELFKDRPRLSLKTSKPPSTPPAAPKPSPALQKTPAPKSAVVPKLSPLRIAIDQRAAALREDLARRFPRCFVPVGSEPRPLKIGI